MAYRKVGRAGALFIVRNQPHKEYLVAYGVHWVALVSRARTFAATWARGLAIFRHQDTDIRSTDLDESAEEETR
eukprot:scaffold501_cov407-Prasinococcus_capsulatus_cf.AAC.4